jgi:hypothetical protein
MKKENLSVVTFRPSGADGAKIAGEVISIEFVPPYFKFLGERKPAIIKGKRFEPRINAEPHGLR